MKQQDKHINKKFSFAENSHSDKGISDLHKEYLGLETPENFFADSKKEILESVSAIDTTKPIKQLHSGRRHIKRVVAAAAVIILLITSAFLLYFNSSIFDQNNLFEAELTIDNDFIFTGLFSEDKDLDSFIDAYIYEDILLEAELQDDNVIMNSLLMEDADADQYIDDYLIEKLIL